LRRRPYRDRRALVDVDLAGHEEEIVTQPVQQDPGIQHPRQPSGIAVREERVAQRPRGHADQQDAFDAEADEEQRQEQHEAELRHLPEAHFARGLAESDLIQEEVREGVVELQRDAEQKRSDDERRERPVAYEPERVEPQHVAYPQRLPRGMRWRVRQHQRVEPEQDRGSSRDLEWYDRRLDMQSANQQSGHDPADRAQRPNRRELPRRLLHVIE
jgi:hypothetical protein